MKEWLANLKPQSRKLFIMLTMVALYVVNDLCGQILTEQAMESIMAIVIAWIVGQGIADHGAQGKAKAILRMKNETEEMRNLVKEVLGPGTPIAQRLNRTAELPEIEEEEDEGPSWEETTEMDDEDQPRELNG